MIDPWQQIGSASPSGTRSVAKLHAAWSQNQRCSWHLQKYAEMPIIPLWTSIFIWQAFISVNAISAESIRISAESQMSIQDALESSCGFSFVAALTSTSQLSRETWRNTTGSTDPELPSNLWTQGFHQLLPLKRQPRPVPTFGKNFDVFKKGQKGMVWK